MNNIKTTYSLDLIAQRRAEKKAELTQSTEQVTAIAHKIMAPPQNKSNTELWMHYASNGITTFNGIITCIKLYRKMKSSFSKKNKKKKGFFSWL